MMTKYQQQHRQQILQEHNTGQVKGTTWGAMRPPERQPFGRGTEVSVRASMQRVGSSFLKKCKRFPLHTQNILKAHVESRGSRPCSHLRGGKGRQKPVGGQIY